MGLQIIQGVEDEVVAATMRAYERAVVSVFGQTRWVYNRDVGPQRNRNYKMWGKLAVTLHTRRWDPREFFDYSLREWVRYAAWKAGQSGTPVERVPYISRLVGPRTLDAFERRLADPGYRKVRNQLLEIGDAEWWHWRFELRDGVVIMMRVMRFRSEESDALQFCWRAVPAIFLAACEVFWSADRDGWVQEDDVAFVRARDLRDSLRRDVAQWAKLRGEYAAAWAEVRSGRYK